MSLPCLQTSSGVPFHIMGNKTVLSGLSYLHGFLENAASLAHQPLIISNMPSSLAQACPFIRSCLCLAGPLLCALLPGTPLRSSARTAFFGKLSPAPLSRRSSSFSGLSCCSCYSQSVSSTTSCDLRAGTIFFTLISLMPS